VSRVHEQHDHRDEQRHQQGSGSGHDHHPPSAAAPVPAPVPPCPAQSVEPGHFTQLQARAVLRTWSPRARPACCPGASRREAAEGAEQQNSGSCGAGRSLTAHSRARPRGPDVYKRGLPSASSMRPRTALCPAFE
jgi:hypothetical protein